MFTNILWTDYFVVVAISLTFYYLFLGVRYYSAELKDLFSGKRKLHSRAALPNDKGAESILTTEQNYTGKSTASKETKDEDFAEVEHLIERIKEIIADASGKKLIPLEFKQYLHLVLREYPNIKNSPFRSSINELVVSECEKYEAVTLSEDEVELLWKDTM
ncbi:MAG: hypothetical protein GZ094_18395 [Mariniphaga sp.]|nr:hypothetical protein [Mariniphaga sp.]